MSKALISPQIMAVLMGSVDEIVRDRPRLFFLARGRRPELFAAQTPDLVTDFLARLIERCALHLQEPLQRQEPAASPERDAAIAREVLRLVAAWPASEASCAEAWQLALNFFLLDNAPTA